MRATQLSKHQTEQLTKLNEQMSAEIMELMQQNTLPEEFIHPKLSEWLTCALPHETTKMMGCSYADFKKFWLALCSKPVNEYNLWEMGFAINCVESKSMVQLHANNPAAYLVIQDAITEMAIRWNEMVNNIKGPTTERYKAMMDRVKANKAIMIPNKEILS